MKRTMPAITASLMLGLSLSSSSLAQALTLEPLGTHRTGIFDEGAAEIVAYHAKNQQIFKVNAKAAAVEVLDISNPASPVLVGQIDASLLGGSANSVAVYKNLVVVAIEAENKQDNGLVAFYNATDLSLLKTVPAGALPDMVTFTPNGQFALVANEGEPSDDYSIDPDGSVSVIDLRKGVNKATVKTATFDAYNGSEASLREKGIRIFGPDASASQDLEPEYITVSRNSNTAWVVLQEANAVAVIDIKRAEVIDLLPLGTKNHHLVGNELDASNRDEHINITNWPVNGFYMPDAIASYQFNGDTYLVTANEGDSRDYDGYSEEARVKDLPLDPAAFPDAEHLQADENLGRLKVTTANGDSDGDGDFDTLYSYGARSFSIWSEQGELVFDSGADFEMITAAMIPADFNSTNDENGSFDNRSDDKGPEPEGIALGKIKGHTIAFIGLERIGGIMAYDITNPAAVKFLNYFNNRDFSADVQLPDNSVNPQAGDLAPEGLVFIPAAKSPNGKPLLVTGNEVSGTTTVFQVNYQ